MRRGEGGGGEEKGGMGKERGRGGGVRRGEEGEVWWVKQWRG